MGNGGEECSVEELALQHYAAQAGGSWTGKTHYTLHTAHHHLPAAACWNSCLPLHVAVLCSLGRKQLDRQPHYTLDIAHRDLPAPAT